MYLDGQARKTDGYAMAALLVAIAVMAILMTAAMPTWRQAAQREREAELIFRGKQYARAIELFQRKFANAFPPNFDVLYEQRFLRAKYKDPMVEDGEFQLLYQLDMQQAPGRAGGRPGAAGPSGSVPGRGGQAGASTFTAASTFMAAAAGGQVVTSGPRGGVIGVVSKSKDQSIRLYNGRNYYNEWQFVYVPTMVGRGGMPGGVQRPGQRPGAGSGEGGGQGGFGGGRGPGGRGGEGGQRGMGPGGPGTGFGPGRGGLTNPPLGRGRGPG